MEDINKRRDDLIGHGILKTTIPEAAEGRNHTERGKSENMKQIMDDTKRSSYEQLKRMIEDSRLTANNPQ